MSLINKMLQDLDARGTTAAGEAYAPQVKPVAGMRRAPPLRALAAGVGGALAGLALAWLAWQHWQRAEPAPTAAPAQARPAPVPAPAPAPAPVGQAPAPTQAVAPDQVRAAIATPAGKDVAPLEPDSAEARALRRALAATLAERQAAAAPRQSPRMAAAPRDRATPAGDAAVKPRARAQDKVQYKVQDGTHARTQDRSRDKAQPTGRREGAAQGRQENGFQRAEGAYRRALASLQEGRMGETVAALEEALRIEPGHEAARQTLVGLLIEAGRGDEAMRQLQLGLARDARQPALAMLLARLQIERGGNGIETLMRTLPHAGNNPDYHAFLAGALQRQQRHREAAEHYLAALRGAPANGVWWMGMGISLQAEKRDAEALDAFRRARASGNLSQELAGFVERRVQQLER